MDEILKKTQSDYNTIACDFSQKRRYLWKEIKPFLRLVKVGDKVLDAGSGNGRLYPYLRKKKVNYLGIDFSQELLKIARKENPQAKFIYGDLAQTKTFKNLEGFDGCFCIAVLHGLVARELQIKVLENIHKSLKPGGILIISVWNLWTKKFLKFHLRQIPWKIIKGFKLKWLKVPYKVMNGQKIIVNRLLYAYSKKEFRDLIKLAGFKILTQKSGQNLCFLAEKLV